ncbi:aminotransferase class I/II-fold pyridoxal phosphate-dependent enzyme [Dyadobacter sp.]|uniref:aminotransferase class I/II-fold pyridoxal phosphate-dependent enzyme n=1 Tax=Dyadobacter sp. TaxID=1914288 RepID=UPI003F6E89DD
MAAHLTNHLPGRTVKTQDGKEYLWFSGTDYLGMGHNADYQTFLNGGFVRYGTHFGSSRNNSLRLTIYSEAEDRFASWQNAPAALLVSSGMLAGQIAMREIEKLVSIIDRADHVAYHYAPRVHPALWGNQYKSSNTEWNAWAHQTVADVNEEKNSFHIICTDAVGSPFAEYLDLSIFNNISAPANCRLIIDQSHTLGVCGAGGVGVNALLNAAVKARTLFVSSLNKAFGIPAGIIWGGQQELDFLSHSPWFAGASPTAPSYVFAFNKLMNNGIYAQMHQVLTQNINHFNNLFSGPECLFKTIAHYPVFCSTNASLFDFLLQNGIMASCFSYPLPSSESVTRIVISAAHQQKDLDRLAEVCKQFIS